MSLLKVKNLNVEYHNRDGIVRAVSNLSFQIEEGEIVGIVGESGSGKTSTMMALLGLLPENVKVTAEEMNIDRSQLSMIFQDPSAYLDDAMTVGRQITETIRAHKKCTRVQAAEEARQLLDLVGISNPGKRMRQYPYALSGGMRQRVVIAIALACYPKVLIADEPTTALDVTVQSQILAILRRIARETGTAILLVSHDLGVIASLCQKVFVMKDGELKESGSVEDIFYEPSHPYTKELLMHADSMFASEGAKQNTEKSDQASEEQVLLQLKNVSMFYKGKSFLWRNKLQEGIKEVSLVIHEGEAYGLVGESGCGKTTLAKLIVGLNESAQGEIFYRGQSFDLLTGRRKRRGKGGVQMVFQNSYASLNPRMSAGEMLEEVLMLQGIKDKKKRIEKVYEALEMTGLRREDAGRYPREFSGGQRQRLSIARALIQDPQLLVLDEALSGLDLSVQVQILSLLEKIRNKQKVAYLFISHDLSAVRRLCKKIGVMYHGQIVESGNTEDICEEPWHPYTKALLQATLFPDPLKARRLASIIWAGEDRKAPEEGCPYAPLCGYEMECCSKGKLPTYRYGTREISCFLYSSAQNGRSADYEMTVQI